jgi:hypothetical protein
MMIINVCRPALVAWARVRNFDEYRKSIGLSEAVLGDMAEAKTSLNLVQKSLDFCTYA